MPSSMDRAIFYTDREKKISRIAKNSREFLLIRAQFVPHLAYS